MPNNTFVLSCTPGLEGLLSEEITELGSTVEEDSLSGSVEVSCDFKEAAALAHYSKIASHLFVQIDRFAFGNPDRFEKKLLELPWEEYISKDFTISVQAAGLFSGKNIKRSFVPLKVKDSICDRLKSKGGGRPDVDTKNPDISVQCYFHRKEVQVLLKLNSKPLHQRAKRLSPGLAPIRENKAAALLRFAGFDPTKDRLADPFCGSGTIFLEALEAIHRNNNSVEISPELEAMPWWREWIKALDQVESRSPIEREIDFFGADMDEEQLETAKENLERAAGAVEITKKSALSWEEGVFKNCFIACNPPHGDRVFSKTKAEKLLREFIRKLKFENAPCRLALSLSNDDLYKSVGLKPSRKLTVGTGEQSLKFLYYEIY